MTSSKRSVFVSYRRASAAYAGHLVADLRRSGLEVFRDIDRIEAGAEYARVINETIERSDSLVAIIDPDWLGCRRRPRRHRIFGRGDWVRQELASALALDVRIVPVLVGGAKMPAADDLPRDLKGLADRQAITLTEEYWDIEVRRLLEVVDRPPPPRDPQPVPRARLGDVPRSWLAAPAALALVLPVILALALNGGAVSRDRDAAYERAMRAAFAHVITTGSDLTKGLGYLKDEPPAKRNLVKVKALSGAIDDAVEAWVDTEAPDTEEGARLSGAAETTLTAARSYADAVKAALSASPSPRKAAAADRAREKFEAAFDDLGDTVARDGADSVRNAGKLKAWSKRWSGGATASVGTSAGAPPTTGSQSGGQPAEDTDEAADGEPLGDGGDGSDGGTSTPGGCDAKDTVTEIIGNGVDDDCDGVVE